MVLMAVCHLAIGKIAQRVVTSNASWLSAHLCVPTVLPFPGDPPSLVTPQFPRPLIGGFFFFFANVSARSKMFIFCFLLTFKIPLPFLSPPFLQISTLLCHQHVLSLQKVQIVFPGSPECLNLAPFHRPSPTSVPHTPGVL